jgi:predicted  nucleic acid-binding Zn-ribbon protein
MNNKQYKEEQKLKQHLSDRNLKAIVDYMNAQRKQINDLNVEIVEWKKIISNYVKIVTDLQREVGELRNEVQISRFTHGPSVK